MLILYLPRNAVDEHCPNGGKECCDSIESYCPVSDRNKKQWLKQGQRELTGHLSTVVGGQSVPARRSLFVDNHSLHWNYMNQQQRNVYYM